MGATPASSLLRATSVSAGCTGCWPCFPSCTSSTSSWWAWPQPPPRRLIRDLVFRAQWVTVVSWLTYPVVYIFPMLGFKGAQAVVNIQVGYCVSDVISKCGVGLIIYSITSAKSAMDKEGLLR